MQDTHTARSIQRPTPHRTPHSTPRSNPRSNPRSTPHSTQCSILRSTLLNSTILLLIQLYSTLLNSTLLNSKTSTFASVCTKCLFLFNPSITTNWGEHPIVINPICVSGIYTVSRIITNQITLQKEEPGVCRSLPRQKGCTRS